MWNILITAIFGAICVALIAFLVKIELQRYRLLKLAKETVETASRRPLPTPPKPKNY